MALIFQRDKLGRFIKGHNSPLKKRIIKNCLVCKKEIEVAPWENKRKFCSLKCKGIWQSKNLKGENNPSWKGKKEIICSICKKSFPVYLFYYKRGQKFCSVKCANVWKKMNQCGKNHYNWQGGKSFEPYGIEFNNQLKEKIRQRDNYRCQECFRHQNELYDKAGRKYKLIVHHIDYNKKNNSENNLIPLCRNCHQQTNYKRQDWTKYFQNKLATVA